ncbi:MAG: hypothetical protein JXR19_02835 [Bacteroidia bacterium]
MKKLSLFILVLLAGTFALTTNTSCSGSGSEPLPDDTTDNNPDPVAKVNGFKIGIDPTYELDIVEPLTYAVYNKAANKTYVFVSGNDGTKPQNEQDADFGLEFNTNMMGTYTKNEGARIDVGTGSGIKRIEYTSDGAAITITVTEYGAVGGRVKGTFSGTVKAANQVGTVNITGGFFDVKRIDDE